MRQAELGYRLGQPDEVWKLMREARPLAGPSDLEYWRSLAEQAWARDAQAEALAAYRMLWAAGKAESLRGRAAAAAAGAHRPARAS